MSAERPMPVVTDENRPFWEAAGRHELRLQCCGNCGHIRPVPADLCPRCLSEETEWRRMSGSGTISSWCTYHRAFHPAFEDAVPYVIAQVDLEEGVRFVAPLKVAPDEKLALGRPVRVGFERVNDEVTLPVLELVEQGG